MPFEIVTLQAGGITFQPVTIAVRVSHEEAARSFEAKLKHPQYPQAALLEKLRQSPDCTIRARRSDGVAIEAAGGGDLMLTGHVEKRSPRLGAEEKELPVSGRSKTGDLIDSSAEHKSGEWREKKAPDALRDLAEAHGIAVESDVEHKTRPVARLRPGETVFAFAERWARAEGFTITDTPQGTLKLAREPKKAHAGVIADGSGWPALVSASAVHDDSKRFKDVKVKAQAPDGYAADQLEIEGKASDEGGARNRTRIIVPPEVIKKNEARDRAKWHRDRAAGEGTTAEITVKGWRDQAGTLWTPGWTIAVDIADLGLKQGMMIKTVSFEQSDASGDGTVARLSLVDPRAFGGKAGKGAKSGKQWDLGKAGGDDA